MSHRNLTYKAVDDVIAAFHACKKPISGIRAGRGTGKSVAAQIQLVSEAFAMPPCADNVRRSRFLITRSSYRDLASSALKTYEAMFTDVPGFLPIAGKEPWTGGISTKLPDGTLVESSWIFMAVAEDDMVKLRSMEYTSSYINELVNYNTVDIIPAIMASCNRYPSKSEFSATYVQEQERRGLPMYNGRVIFDTNGSSRDHWFAKLSDDPPSTWGIFVQEPPLIEFEEPQPNGVTVRDVHYGPNPKCKYAHIQSKGFRYWVDILPGSTDEYIQASVLGGFSDSVSGKRVFSSFGEDHVAKNAVDPKDFEGCHLICGIDTSGHHPAMVVTTVRDGTFYLLDEISVTDTSYISFIDDYVVPLLSSKWGEFSMHAVLDPSNPASGIDKRTAMQITLGCGLEAELASTNFFGDRMEAVNKWLNRRNGFVIYPNCELALAGFRGRYHYGLVRGKPGVYKATPDKTTSHADIMDAIQYSALGYTVHSAGRESAPVIMKPSQRRAV